MLKDLNTLVSLCKRRGYIFPSSEVYGGLSACWDYGPLGVQLKRNIKQIWWEEMTKRLNVVGLDSSILMHPRVWEASGHVESFSDPMVDCLKCRFRFRSEKKLNQCPKCGSTELTKPRPFHLMFKTQIGSLEEEAQLIYLRPETAQGMYVNFLNVKSSMRQKIPFGIAQIGKAFRNEITVGNFIFRCREFEQMEMQYFVHPEKAESSFVEWVESRKQFLLKLGIPESSLQLHEHKKEELAHYAQSAIDIQFHFPMGWEELEGIHNRGDFDLKQHQKFSGKKMTVFDEDKNQTYTPYVIETSIGCDRLILSLLCSSYKEETVKKEQRVVLSLHPHLSPVQVAIMPLSKKNHLMEMAHQMTHSLKHKWRLEYDDTGSIGKRYRRQDEIGTPFCITIDFDSLEDKKVTVRHRDSMHQDRLPIDNLDKYLADKFTQF